MTHPAIDPKVIEAEENLLIDFQFLLQEVMTEKEISRTELAEKTGLSKARLTQILGSEANPTIKSIARLFFALEEKVCLSRKPLSLVENSPIPVFDKHAKGQWDRKSLMPEKRDDRDFTSAMKKSQRELARALKRSLASNDNRAAYDRVMIIASDEPLAPEPEAAYG